MPIFILPSHGNTEMRAAYLVCDAAEGRLAHGRGPVLDLEQQLQDLALLGFLGVQLRILK